MTIPVEKIAEEVERRYSQRLRGDLTTKATYTIPASLVGKVQVAAEWAEVTRSALVTLLLEDAIEDIERQFEQHGYPSIGDEEDDE